MAVYSSENSINFGTFCASFVKSLLAGCQSILDNPALLDIQEPFEFGEYNGEKVTDYFKEGKILRHCELDMFKSILERVCSNTDEFESIYESYLLALNTDKLDNIYEKFMDLSKCPKEETEKIDDKLDLLYFAVRRTAKKIMKEYVMPLRKTERKEIESSSLPIYSDSEIEQYLENGIVAKNCDMATFEELLNCSSYSESRKFELLAQMKNLQNREYRRKMDEMCRKVFSSYELELYNNAKGNSEAKSILEDIDYLVEQLLGDSSEEAILIISEELVPLFARLNEIVNKNIDTVTKAEEIPNDIPKITFFKDKVVQDDGNISYIPRILTSIIAGQKSCYKQAYIQLSKLLSGMIGGDRPVQGNNLPCKICYKGKEFKIFYTMLGEVPVIIDGAVGDCDYQKIVNTVKSKEFLSYLKSLQETIISDGTLDESDYIDMIMRELSKSGAVKKVM